MLCYFFSYSIYKILFYVFAFIQVQTIGFPEGIAVDWVSKNLYWIETSVRTKVIKVASVEGKNIRTLIKLETDRKPQNIVLDPQSGCDIYVLTRMIK